ncbi:MAG: GatB/YqeY domain-containing protein [Kiritimatiellia bacterium]
MKTELIDQIMADIKTAMRAGERDKLTVLRMLHASVKDQTVNAGKEITEEIVIAVVAKAIKQRADSIEQFKAAGRDDLVAKEQAELVWLSAYQPAQMDQAAIETVVKACIAESGAVSKADLGKVMKLLMPKVKGLADGKLVNQIVMSLLK